MVTSNIVHTGLYTDKACILLNFVIERMMERNIRTEEGHGTAKDGMVYRCFEARREYDGEVVLFVPENKRTSASKYGAKFEKLTGKGLMRHIGTFIGAFVKSERLGYWNAVYRRQAKAVCSDWSRTCISPIGNGYSNYSIKDLYMLSEVLTGEFRAKNYQDDDVKALVGEKNDPVVTEMNRTYDEEKTKLDGEYKSRCDEIEKRYNDEWYKRYLAKEKEKEAVKAELDAKLAELKAMIDDVKKPADLENAGPLEFVVEDAKVPA